MKNISLYLKKASSLVLLAFCFVLTLSAQQVKSLSGANSPNDDTNPVWIGNNTLLFTRAFHPKNLGGISDPGDIWMTQKDNSGEWMTAVHRPDLSSKGYDLPLGMEDALTLVILRQEIGSVSLHQYSKFGQDWNYLRQIKFPNIQPQSGYVTGRIVEGGNQIILSAALEGSIGNEDLYISEKTGPGEWSALSNLGSVINGTGQEVGPFFDARNQELFYSTNSHPGATGKDILIAKKLGDSWQSWSVPVKWEQISSRGSEASITLIEGKEVVWTSTQNSDGFADLMTFATPVPLAIPTEFKAPVISSVPEQNVKTPEVKKEPIPSISQQDTVKTEVRLPKVPIPSDTNKVVEAIVPQKEIEIPVSFLAIDGKSKKELTHSLSWQIGIETVGFEEPYLISSLKEKRITAVKVSSQGYFPKLLMIESLNPKSKTLVLLTKVEAGSTVLLEDVNFKRGTAELEEEDSEASLSELAKFLLENPKMTIRINGHTDNVGDPGLNKKLSLERAGSVRDFLVSKGVEFERLRISGWGGTRPIASNATESGRSQNRRVELVVEN